MCIKSADKYISEHEDTCYCEAIILPDGSITDARPSHTYRLIRLTGKSKSELDNMMPIYAAPLEWLLGYTGCISVWYNSFIYSSLTDNQKLTLQALVNSGVLSTVVKGIRTVEFEKCKEIEDLNNGLRESLTEYKTELIYITKEYYV